MTTDFTARQMNNIFPRYLGRDLCVMECPQPDMKELFMTFLPVAGAVTESIEQIYDRITELVANLGAEVVNERCYAIKERYGEIADIRSRFFASRGLEEQGTLSFIGAVPLGDGPIAGIQVWAVQSAEKPGVRTMYLDSLPVGRKFTYQGVSYGSVASLGPIMNGKGTPSRQAEAASMFRHAGQVLSGYGFTYRDVARTWIYLPRLLSWYDEFNSARREVFQEVGLIGGSEGLWLPASTGIQGRSPRDHECMMDLLAVAGREQGRVRMQMLESPLQCEAYDYGSSFSRAVELRDSATSRVYVSGTASIDREGRTVHHDDPIEQIRFTIEVVRKLLATRHHDFSHVSQCVAFLKKAEYAQAFEQATAEAGFDPRVVVPTVADVCRGDLLFEIEVMTVRPLVPADQLAC